MAVPSAPTLLVPVAGDTQVSITWQPVTATPVVTDYVIEYSTNGANWTVFSDGVSATASVVVTGLVNDQLYLFRIAAVNSDGQGAYSAIATATPFKDRQPTYCQVSDIADWLRIDINANTDPNTSMVRRFILMNEDHIDRETGHTWQTDKLYRTDTFDVSDIYDYGRGMYIPLKHRNIKDWDPTKGDKFEIWDGTRWVEQTINTPTDTFVNIEPTKGALHIRGYFYTIIRKSRFRLTYRYGGDKEGETVPRDIQQCCILLTAIDILSQDFKMSQLAYGGEGNVNKKDIMEKWKAKADKIIWNHSEIQVVW